MSNYTIITNNHPRPLILWDELTPAEQAEYDWDGAEEQQFFRYKGWCYCMADFIRTDEWPDLRKWHGIKAESYSSAVAVRFADLDIFDEEIIVATILS